MSETLTINQSNADTQTTESNLTPDEQDSLKVGEDLQSQQEGLLAGKYKNAQELEKAYAELEKKLGEDNKEEVSESEPSNDAPVPEASEQTTLITDASTEYAENGNLSPETLEKFSSMSSKQLVEAYVELQKNNTANTSAPVQDLTESEVNTIHNSVGGERSYSDIVNWASKNLPSNEVEAFDSLINSGNISQIQLAVTGLKAQYENANGYEGRMLSGKSPKTSGDVYRSQQELVTAMADPRYDNDPAYRQDVIAKLERSDNLQF